MNNNNEKDKQIQDWLKFLTGTSSGYATIPKGKKIFSYYCFHNKKTNYTVGLTLNLKIESLY